MRTSGTCEEPLLQFQIENWKVTKDNKPHPHAELMALYAQDAAETDRPWERWQMAVDTLNYTDMKQNPSWLPHRNYRRKPQRRTVLMGDGAVLPQPALEALAEGARYYIADNSYTEGIAKDEWYGDVIDHNRLIRGLIHQTEEDAKAWAGYLLKLTSVI